MRARLLTAALCFGLGLGAGEARASPDPKRAVSVLEFRADSAELPDIGERAVKILQESTSLRLIGINDARQRYGGALDADLASCGGAPTCLAEIGEKLEVAEILLVGVSEFGDVILAVQRIDVAEQRVAARMAEALAPGRPPDESALEGYLRRVFPESDFRRFGSIRIQANVRGAEVRVDERRRGVTPLSPLRVPAPATYRIQVSKPGFIAFQASVAVPPDGEIEVHPRLARRQGSPWYQKWWVLAIAGTVAVGASTAAVLATRKGGGVKVKIAPF